MTQPSAPILTPVVGIPATITTRTGLRGQATFDSPYLGGPVGAGVGSVPFEWDATNNRWKNSNTNAALQLPLARADVLAAAKPHGWLYIDLTWTDEAGRRQSEQLRFRPAAGEDGKLDLTRDQDPEAYTTTASLQALTADAEQAAAAANTAAGRVTDAILDLEAERQAVADIIADIAQDRLSTQAALNEITGTLGIAPDRVYPDGVTPPSNLPNGTLIARITDGMLLRQKIVNGDFLDLGAPLATTDVVTIRVSTVAALRARRATGNKLRSTPVETQGYYVPGDGGGGTYDPDSTDTTSTDNGGTVIVGADGLRYRLRVGYVANVLQFGARADALYKGPDFRLYSDAAKTVLATDNLAVFIAARNSLPLFGGGAQARGGILLRRGTIYVPQQGQGAYAISGTFYFTAGMQLVADKGQYVSEIVLQPTSQPVTETFAIAVAPSLSSGGGDFTGNTTHGVNIRNININAGGEAFANTGGLQWYGCEANQIINVGITRFRKRGLVLNDRLEGLVPGNSTWVDNLWISGLHELTEGPGLDVRGNSHVFGVLSVQHINRDGTWKDEDGYPMAAIYLRSAFFNTFLHCEDEDSHVFITVKNSVGNLFATVGAGRTASATQYSTTCGINIIGTSYLNTFEALSVTRMATTFNDATPGGDTKPGNQTGQVYTRYAQRTFENRMFIGAPENNTDRLSVGGLARVRNSGTLSARLILDAAGAYGEQIDFAQDGVSQWVLARRTDQSGRMRLNCETTGARMDLLTSGTLALQAPTAGGLGRLQLYAINNGAQVEYLNNNVLAWAAGNRPDVANSFRFANASGFTAFDIEQAGNVKPAGWLGFSGVAKGALPVASAGRVHYITDAAAGRSGLVVANGTAWSEIPGALTATATLDFPSIPAQGQAELSITVTGASVNDSVSLGPPPAPEPGTQATPRVSAANTVTVRMSNITAAAIDPAAASYKVTVHK